MGVAAVLEPPLHADSNEGMVVKLIILVREGGRIPRKPIQIRVNLFQNKSI